jgi:hypothetical protein
MRSWYIAYIHLSCTIHTLNKTAIKAEDPAEGAALEELAHKLKGREYFLDARLFNSKQLREACIPAANGLFTARALATLHNDFLLALSDDSNNSNSMNSSGSGHAKLLSRDRVDAMRSYAATDASATHR